MANKRRSVTVDLTPVDRSGTTLLGVVEATEFREDAVSVAEASTDDHKEPRSVPDRLELVAEREIVLRCGQASVTLTRAGKIILRGTYLLSRSSGVNSIKGGSVQIN